MNATLKRLLFQICLFCVAGVISAQEDEFVMERKQMVDNQIRARGIKHEATLQAMEKVPRHLFVPDYLLKNAYYDGPLPIGYGQTISQPYIVAYMTAMLEPGKQDKVLEVGTGSGYQAAILSEIVDSVFSIEVVDELAKNVKKKLQDMGYGNIRVKTGDGYFGWKEHAPFDKIIVTAAADKIPDPLVEQLKEGGRMIIPVGSEYGVQYLVLTEKKDGNIVKKKLLPVRFVPFTRE